MPFRSGHLAAPVARLLMAFAPWLLGSFIIVRVSHDSGVPLILHWAGRLGRPMSSGELLAASPFQAMLAVLVHLAFLSTLIAVALCTFPRLCSGLVFVTFGLLGADFGASFFQSRPDATTNVVSDLAIPFLLGWAGAGLWSLAELIRVAWKRKRPPMAAVE